MDRGRFDGSKGEPFPASDALLLDVLIHTT